MVRAQRWSGTGNRAGGHRDEHVEGLFGSDVDDRIRHESISGTQEDLGGAGAYKQGKARLRRLGHVQRRDSDYQSAEAENARRRLMDGGKKDMKLVDVRHEHKEDRVRWRRFFWKTNDSKMKKLQYL